LIQELHKMKRRGVGKKGISPVISGIILMATVIVIGTSVWAFTYSVGSVLQRNYFEETNAEIIKLKERFTVENINFNSSTNQLHVWIYNYGSVTIEIDVYVLRNSTDVGEDLNGTKIPVNEVALKTIQLLQPVETSDILIIEVLTRRNNVVYAEYLVP